MRISNVSKILSSAFSCAISSSLVPCDSAVLLTSGIIQPGSASNINISSTEEKSEIVEVSTYPLESKDSRSISGPPGTVTPVKVTQLSSVSDSQELGADSKISSVHFPTSGPTLAETRYIISMAELYSDLLVHLYIPFSVGVPFLSKLIGFPPIENVDHSGVTNSGTMNFLSSDSHMRVFAAKAMELSISVIGYLGPAISSEISSSDSMQLHSPEAVFNLRNLSDDIYLYGSRVADSPSAGGIAKEGSGFLRPFHSDIDDRNQYKSQVSFETKFNITILDKIITSVFSWPIILFIVNEFVD